MAKDPHDTREAMLDAVAELISEDGVRNLSLREVARRAGVSHATPGHHFGDKDGMLAAFAEKGFRLFADEFAGQRGGMLDGRAYIRFAVSHQPYFEVMFRSGLDTSTHPGLAEGASAAFDSLVAAVDDAQKRGGPAEGYPATIVAVRMWSMVHGLASLIIDGQLEGIVDDDELEWLMMQVLEADV